METRECRYCKGTGHRQTDNIPHVCEDCDGSGKEYLCPFCREWKNALEMDMDEEMCTDCRDRIDAEDWFGLVTGIVRRGVK